MASSSNLALLLLLLSFSLLAASAAARPCKTLFFISTTSYYHQFPISQNPNPTRFHTFFISTSAVPSRFGFGRPLLRPSIIFRRSDPIMIRKPDPVVEEQEEDPIMMPMELYSSVTNSIRDRSKDIMRVVGALLFGVGCGALTAATMYLIWSLFWPNRYDFDDSDADDLDDYEFDAKKLGYMSIPNKVVDDDELKKKPAAPVAAAAPAKDVAV